MSESMRQAIEELKKHIFDLENQVIDSKRTVNSMCRHIGEPPVYADAEMTVSAAAKALKGDEYFNKPLATAVRMVLEARRTSDLGPATTDELFDALKAGGYEFTGKEDVAKRGLAISLAKNTTMFCRLKSGKFGLAEWYGLKPKNGGRKAAVAVEEGSDARDEPIDAEQGQLALESQEAVEEASPRKPR